MRVLKDAQKRATRIDRELEERVQEAEELVEQYHSICDSIMDGPGQELTFY